MEKDTSTLWQFRTPAAFGVEDEAGRTKTSRSTLAARAAALAALGLQRAEQRARGRLRVGVESRP